jgi:hypothetical protein
MLMALVDQGGGRFDAGRVTILSLSRLLHLESWSFGVLDQEWVNRAPVRCSRLQQFNVQLPFLLSFHSSPLSADASKGVSELQTPTRGPFSDKRLEAMD